MTDGQDLPGSNGRALIVIDQEPLRRATRVRCQRALAVLKKRRQQLGVFEREDRPAFVRWLAKEFGALLTSARELDAQISAKQKLLREVEEEMRASTSDPITAYRRVRFRKRQPSPAKLPEPPPEKNEAAESLNNEEKETIFKNWLFEYFGIDPEKMEASAYKTTYGNFRVHLFGEQQGVEESIHVFSAPEPPSPQMKEVYRVLVRRLHPDRLGDAQAGGLWHEVQKAYAARDLERMETLLAFTEIEAGDLGPRTSLFRLRSAGRELTRTLRALRQSLQAATANKAWNFSRATPSEFMRTRVRVELEGDLARQQQTLDYLTKAIAEFAGTPKEFAGGFSMVAHSSASDL